MTEAQLALKFIDYFAEFDIYKEVPGGGGRIDIVAVTEKIRTAIEVKVHLSFEVIWQAYQSRVQCHYAYAAVPVKNWNIHPAQKKLCLHLGIGVLGCMELQTANGNFNKKNQHKLPTHEIREIIKPQLNRHARKIMLHEYMKRSQAGSQSSYITAFGFFVEGLTAICARHPEGIEVKKAFEDIEFKHYRTVSIFRNAVVKYCNSGVIKNIQCHSGKLFYIKS